MKISKYTLRAVFLIAVLASTLSFTSKPAGAQIAADVNNFKIASFSADYYLARTDNKRSTMQVTETIVAQFPEYDQNHGILRSIPETYLGHSLEVNILSVTKADGTTNWSYSTYGSNGNLVLKIGDANSFVRGRQTYVISYSLKNVALFLDDHEELYWDVNGTDWQQPFDSVTARLHLSPEVSAAYQDATCFSGYIGSNDQTSCTTSDESFGSDQKVITFRASNLQAGQTLTFATRYQQGTFAPSLSENIISKTNKHIAVISIISTALLPAITGIWAYRKWRSEGRDYPSRGIIIPQYEPPKQLSVIECDFIMNESLRTNAISAALIDLAIKGYVAIYENKKSWLGNRSYDIELTRSPANLSEVERKILELFFTDNKPGERHNISDFKNKLQPKIAPFHTYISDRLQTEGYFSNNVKKTKTKYVLVGTLIGISGVIFSYAGIITPLLTILTPVGVGMVLSVVIISVLSKSLPARTAKGVAADEQLMGLKQYIALAEKDRIAFLQSPDGAVINAAEFNPEDKSKKIKLFEKLLPFAILFGIEQNWAKQFNDIYTTPPNWYHGDYSAFNAVYLAQSLHSVSSASNAAFAATSSSGSSGFGGGGFSGGGGGGGGGGGW